MALIVEKFSLTYYTNVFGWKLHTPRMLAFLKCFGEDIPQFIIQIIFIFSIHDASSSVVYFAMGSSLVSLTISFIAFLIATSSILSNKDLEKLREAGVITNFSKIVAPAADRQVSKKIDEKKQDVRLWSISSYFLFRLNVEPLFYVSYLSRTPYKKRNMIGKWPSLGLNMRIIHTMTQVSVSLFIPIMADYRGPRRTLERKLPTRRQLFI